MALTNADTQTDPEATATALKVAAGVTYSATIIRAHREGRLRCHSRQSTGLESRDGPRARDARASRLASVGIHLASPVGIHLASPVGSRAAIRPRSLAQTGLSRSTARAASAANSAAVTPRNAR